GARRALHSFPTRRSSDLARKRRAQLMCRTIGETTLTHYCGLQPLEKLFDRLQERTQLDWRLHFRQRAIVTRAAARQQIANVFQGSQAVSYAEPYQYQASEQRHDKGQPCRQDELSDQLLADVDAIRSGNLDIALPQHVGAPALVAVYMSTETWLSVSQVGAACSA